MYAHKRIYTHMRTQMHTTYTHVHTHIHVNTHVHVDMPKYTYTHVHVHTNTHTNTRNICVACCDDDHDHERFTCFTGYYMYSVFAYAPMARLTYTYNPFSSQSFHCTLMYRLWYITQPVQTTSYVTVIGL